MAQNTVQNSNVLLYEDAIVYKADYITNPTDDVLTDLVNASWTNLGALSEFSVENGTETVQPGSFNVEHDQIITKEIANISLGLQELDLSILNKLKGSLGQETTVAASIVSGATQTIASGSWSYNGSNIIENQNGDLTALTINSVTGGTDGLLVEDADYFVGLNNDGQTIVTVIDSATVTTLSQTMVVDYDYTPYAQTIIWEGGADLLTSYMLRIDTVEADGRILRRYFPNSQYVGGGEIADKAQASGEYKDSTVSIIAKEHPNFTKNGRKLYTIKQYIAA